MMRLFFAGRPLLPVRSAGSLSLILSHSRLLISYRFILLFYHFSVLCASFIFQTRPNSIIKVCMIRIEVNSHSMPLLAVSSFHYRYYIIKIMEKQRNFFLYEKSRFPVSCRYAGKWLLI